MNPTMYQMLARSTVSPGALRVDRPPEALAPGNRPTLIARPQPLTPLATRRHSSRGTRSATGPDSLRRIVGGGRPGRGIAGPGSVVGWVGEGDRGADRAERACQFAIRPPAAYRDIPDRGSVVLAAASGQ